MNNPTHAQIELIARRYTLMRTRQDGNTARIWQDSVQVAQCMAAWFYAFGIDVTLPVGLLPPPSKPAPVDFLRLDMTWGHMPPQMHLGDLYSYRTHGWHHFGWPVLPAEWYA